MGVTLAGSAGSEPKSAFSSALKPDTTKKEMRESMKRAFRRIFSACRNLDNLPREFSWPLRGAHDQPNITSTSSSTTLSKVLQSAPIENDQHAAKSKLRTKRVQDIDRREHDHGDLWYQAMPGCFPSTCCDDRPSRVRSQECVVCLILISRVALSIMSSVNHLPMAILVRVSPGTATSSLMKKKPSNYDHSSSNDHGGLDPTIAWVSLASFVKAPLTAGRGGGKHSRPMVDSSGIRPAYASLLTIVTRLSLESITRIGKSIPRAITSRA